MNDYFPSLIFLCVNYWNKLNEILFVSAYYFSLTTEVIFLYLNKKKSVKYKIY